VQLLLLLQEKTNSTESDIECIDSILLFLKGMYANVGQVLIQSYSRFAPDITVAIELLFHRFWNEIMDIKHIHILQNYLDFYSKLMPFNSTENVLHTLFQECIVGESYSVMPSIKNTRICCFLQVMKCIEQNEQIDIPKCMIKDVYKLYIYFKSTTSHIDASSMQIYTTGTFSEKIITAKLNQILLKYSLRNDTSIRCGASIPICYIFHIYFAK
jgi:hypothetical protein